MVRVLVNGARGKMGQEVVKAANAEPGIVLAGESDIEDELEAAIVRSKAQVVVDFTTAGAGIRNLETIIRCGVHPVIGTSGFKQDEVSRLQRLAAEKKLGGVIAPNFAIGAVLMMKFAVDAAKYFPEVEIIETHHDAKADSPSGTAIRTAELIAAAREKPQKTLSEVGILPGARGAQLDGIHIHSIRLPGFVAKQQIVFGANGQTLTLTHDSNHRESFMPGVMLACKAVLDRSELFYGLEHLL